MVNRLLKLVILIFMIVGIWYGISITIKREVPKYDRKEAELKILNTMKTKSAEAINVYTYGKSLNVDGKISNVNKDNFESLKLYITDGLNYEENYNLDYSFENNDLLFSSKIINSGLVIDDLENGEYYIFARLKVNNSVEPKYYSFVNSSDAENIEYYTVTKESKNRKANIAFCEKDYNGKKYNLLTMKIEDATLPENIYDIVIDAGHGGRDSGEILGSVTEANVMLEYAYSLKNELETLGYKVKLTRDESNSSSFTTTNMYNSDGRISIACKTKAKLMISFHINNDANKELTGFEIYSPPKSDLNFATEMANQINQLSTITFSNNNSFKQTEGVYVRNFTKAIIKEYANTANKKGYEPYNITTDTPYLYTIREVGGVATGAYVDGRNTQYSKNEYYKSNQGIETYQLELGYIKNDIEIITNEKEKIVQAISKAINEKY